MKNKKVIQLEFNEVNLTSFVKSQSAIEEKSRKLIIKEAKETAKHFDEHKWDLTFDSILSDLKIQLLGYNPEWLFMQTLIKHMKRPLYIHHRDGAVISLSPVDQKKKAFGTFTLKKATKAKKKVAKKKAKK
jgi:hypothetical protein